MKLGQTPRRAVSSLKIPKSKLSLVKPLRRPNVPLYLSPGPVPERSLVDGVGSVPFCFFFLFIRIRPLFVFVESVKPCFSRDCRC